MQNRFKKYVKGNVLDLSTTFLVQSDLAFVEELLHQFPEITHVKNRRPLTQPFDLSFQSDYSLKEYSKYDILDLSKTFHVQPDQSKVKPFYILTMHSDNTTLNVSNHCITDDEIPYVIEFLNWHTEITRIDLSKNLITEKGIKYFAQHNHTISYVDFSRNNIGNNGLESFAKYNVKVTHFKVDHIIFESPTYSFDKGLEAFVRHNRFVTYIDLSLCNISDKAIKFFIKKNKKILDAKFDFNHISEVMINKLKGHLKTLQTKQSEESKEFALSTDGSIYIPYSKVEPSAPALGEQEESKRFVLSTDDDVYIPCSRVEPSAPVLEEQKEGQCRSLIADESPKLTAKVISAVPIKTSIWHRLFALSRTELSSQEVLEQKEGSQQWILSTDSQRELTFKSVEPSAPVEQCTETDTLIFEAPQIEGQVSKVIVNQVEGGTTSEKPVFFKPDSQSKQNKKDDKSIKTHRTIFRKSVIM